MVLLSLAVVSIASVTIVAIFYPFSQFCEINVSLLSLQKQPNAAPNLFQRGVEYGKYECYYIAVIDPATIPIIVVRIIGTVVS